MTFKEQIEKLREEADKNGWPDSMFYHESADMVHEAVLRLEAVVGKLARHCGSGWTEQLSMKTNDDGKVILKTRERGCKATPCECKCVPCEAAKEMTKE